LFIGKRARISTKATAAWDESNYEPSNQEDEDEEDFEGEEFEEEEDFEELEGEDVDVEMGMSEAGETEESFEEEELDEFPRRKHGRVETYEVDSIVQRKFENVKYFLKFIKSYYCYNLSSCELI